jgi:hypothetical protein
MSDFIATIIVVFLSLALVSLMLIARLRAGGLSPQRTSMLIAQLWLTVGVIAALFVAMSQALGPPGSSGGLGAEFADLGRRFSALGAEPKSLIIIGGVLALGLFVHLTYSLSRAMRAAPPPS